MTRALYLTMCLTLFFSNNLFSEKEQKGSKTPIGFIENKGQIHDQNYCPNGEVKYLFNSTGINVQLKTNSFSYDTYRIESFKKASVREIGFEKITSTEIIYNFHRVDVEFIGCNANPEIIGDGISSDYINYYTSGTEKSSLAKVRSFSKVIYRNLYPSIDLEFIIQGQKMKYNFILNPGANIDQIQWRYKGQENSILNGNNIEIKVQSGTLIESIPESYFLNNYKKVKSIDVKFRAIDENLFGFNIATPVILKENEQLVIDPTPDVLWATYFGGSSYENFMSSCCDAVGNVYITGETKSANSVATAGVHQAVIGGASDVVILKFGPSGSLKWATYYGGNANDAGNFITLDKFSNLFIVGITNSTNSISTPSVHHVNYEGLQDGFLAKFDTTGVRQWGTYYGGPKYDDLYGCATDSVGNVYIVGSTQSNDSIVTTGAYQTIYGGGPYDAYLVKFNNNGVRQWGTYYGGIDDDGGGTCAVDKSGNIYFGGYSKSSTIMSTSGAHQVGYGGGSDAYLAKFNTNGVRKWSTYYGGAGLDVTFCVHYDTLGFVYISGKTASNDSIATVGSQQPVKGGLDDIFLAKFDTIGARQWATYYGGTNYEYGIYVCSDLTHLYLCGSSDSPAAITTTNVYQPSQMGGNTGVLVKLDKNGVRQWATFFGGWSYDMAESVLVDPFGDVFIVGITDSPSLAVGPAYQTTTGGGFAGFCAKFTQIPTTPTVTSIQKNIDKENLFSVFPNPNNGSFYIESYEEDFVTITNDLGQKVQSLNLNSSNSYRASISNLNSGIYFIASRERKTTRKIIVIK